MPIPNKQIRILMKTHVYHYLVPFAFVAILLAGCQGGTKKTAENDIRFDSIQVDKTYHLLGSPDNPNCNLQLNFVYPAGGLDKATLEKIQHQFVAAYFGEKYETLPPREAAARYTDDYLADYKELEDDFKKELTEEGRAGVGAWYSYYEMSENDIAYNQNDLLSYTVSMESYTGGAHGAHARANHVVNLKTGKPVTEEDIFIENYQDNLAQILIDEIAKDNNVENPKELENMGFFSVDEIFPNGNFLIDNEGITYTFNEYEIAAYVVGATQVRLPFAKISYLLKKESPISHLFDN